MKQNSVYSSWKSGHRVILRGDHRRTIPSGLVNSRARQKPSTKILPCFSPFLVYTSFEHVLFPRCVPLPHRPLHRSVVLRQPLHGDLRLTPAPHSPPPPSHPPPLPLIHGSPHTRRSRSSRVNVNRPKSIPRFSLHYRPKFTYSNDRLSY